MKTTYLLTYNDKKLLYVFDEDGKCSYVPAGDDSAYHQFSTDYFKEKSELARSMCAQIDYNAIGFNMLKELYMFPAQEGSDNILNYCKKFRDMHKGIKLLKMTGILESAYNNPKRMTAEKAIKELKTVSTF